MAFDYKKCFNVKHISSMTEKQFVKQYSDTNVSVLFGDLKELYYKITGKKMVISKGE